MLTNMMQQIQRSLQQQREDFTKQFNEHRQEVQQAQDNMAASHKQIAKQIEYISPIKRPRHGAAASAASLPVYSGAAMPMGAAEPAAAAPVGPSSSSSRVPMVLTDEEVKLLAMVRSGSAPGAAAAAAAAAATAAATAAAAAAAASAGAAPPPGWYPPGNPGAAGNYPYIYIGPTAPGPVSGQPYGNQWSGGPAHRQ
jgi:hypothetical protein